MYDFEECVFSSILICCFFYGWCAYGVYVVYFLAWHLEWVSVYHDVVVCLVDVLYFVVCVVFDFVYFDA